jgi:2-iminoacetate synthase ThiH
MPKYLKFYCGFSLITNQTKMTESEITLEVEALKSRIFDHVLLVTGEATVKYHTISKCN